MDLANSLDHCVTAICLAYTTRQKRIGIYRIIIYSLMTNIVSRLHSIDLTDAICRYIFLDITFQQSINHLVEYNLLTMKHVVLYITNSTYGWI